MGWFVKSHGLTTPSLIFDTTSAIAWIKGM